MFTAMPTLVGVGEKNPCLPHLPRLTHAGWDGLIPFTRQEQIWIPSPRRRCRRLRRLKVRSCALALAALLLLPACTRPDPAAGSPSAEAKPEPVFATKPSFQEIYALLSGEAIDQQRAIRVASGTYVDWEVYVVGVSTMDLNEAARLGYGQGAVPVARNAGSGQPPQQFLIAPSPGQKLGIVMRVGDGFKNREDFGRVVSAFPPGARLRVRGRFIQNGVSPELAVYDIRAL